MKISELTGQKLDYLVAIAEGYVMERPHDMQMIKGEERILVGPQSVYQKQYEYSPSTNWAQGGPIIERECLDLEYHNELVLGDNETWWEAYIRSDCSKVSCGHTPLIAAMRAYVASKFGDEVPDEVPA